MKITEKERKKYIQQIRKNLICSNEQRKIFLDSFSDNIDEYLKDNPDADFSQLQKDLGTPEEIANSFLESVSVAHIKRRMSFVKWIILGVVVALAIYITAIIIALIDAHFSHNGSGTEAIIEETIIEEY